VTTDVLTLHVASVGDILPPNVRKVLGKFVISSTQLAHETISSSQRVKTELTVVRVDYSWVLASPIRIQRVWGKYLHRLLVSNKEKSNPS